MNADEMLGKLGRLIGMGPLAFDDRGVCRLVFDGSTNVDLERSSNAGEIHLHSALGPLKADVAAGTCEMLLAGNLFGRQTAGNVLAVQPTESTIYLCRTQAIDRLEPAEFAEILAEFVRRARQWSRRIEAGPEAAAREDEPPVDLAGMMRV